MTESADHLAAAIRQIVKESVEAALLAHPRAASPPPKLPTAIEHPPDRMLYPIKEIQSKLGISRTMVYQILGDGRLHSVRIGSRRFVTAEALSAYVRGLK